MPKLFRDDSGVSVIVGALLLILIVVIAAAGLAMIVSQAENQQANRQAQQDAIKNENLKIVAIKPIYDMTAGPTYGNLLKINITVQNLNIDDAKINQISLNDNYVIKYFSDGHTYDRATQFLTVPPSKTVVIELDVNPTDFLTLPTINNTDPIKVQVSTSLYNFFEKTFTPPVASAKFDVQTENLGLVQRDYVILDASDSSSDMGLIKVYQWYITDGTDDLWNAIPGYIPPGMILTSGSKIRFSPPSNGPFKVILTVKNNQNDANAMIGNTAEMDIPADPNFCPPLTINPVYYLNNTTIVATLKDATGRVCPNKAITFQSSSMNVIPNQTMAWTDSKGNAVANISFNGVTSGTIMVSYEKLTNSIPVSSLTVPPTANFNAYPLSGNAPLAVQFADTSDRGTGGSITSWQWDFGDGNTSTLDKPTNIFTNLGQHIIQYTVQLIVTNAAGISTPEVKTNFITVKPTKPKPDFTAIQNGSKTIDLAGSYSDGTPISWEWDFGDNSTGSTQTTTHTYGTIGNYSIKLTTSNDGGSNFIIKIVSVT